MIWFSRTTEHEIIHPSCYQASWNFNSLVKKGKKDNWSIHTFPLNNSISPLLYRMITLFEHFSPVKPHPSFEISIRNVPESSLQKSYQTKINEWVINMDIWETHTDLWRKMSPQIILYIANKIYVCMSVIPILIYLVLSIGIDVVHLFKNKVHSASDIHIYLSAYFVGYSLAGTIHTITVCDVSKISHCVHLNTQTGTTVKMRLELQW